MNIKTGLGEAKNKVQGIALDFNNIVELDRRQSRPAFSAFPCGWSAPQRQAPPQTAQQKLSRSYANLITFWTIATVLLHFCHFIMSDGDRYSTQHADK
ncbi:MAG: hypothetical protein WAO21_11325 [Verrucomicrobiia bacterium]